MNHRDIQKLMLSLVMMLFINMAKAQTLSEDLAGIADIIVDQNGGGDYLTVQEGINAIPDNSSGTTILLVKKGTYSEKVILNYRKTNVIMVGEDVDSTIITWDDWGDKMLVNGDPAIGGHTFSTYTFRADPHGFQAYNITFNNPTTKGQGVAFHSNGDKQILYHCRITGNQDTYFDNFRTRRLIKDCFIEGNTDFIFGFGVTLFDSCQIHSVNSGYVTASSTPEYYDFGHVFKNCRITGRPGISSISLGRPWFPYSNTVFYECWLSDGIKKSGWDTWDGREATCFYREFNNYGPGSDTSSRVDFGKQLTPTEAPNYTDANILGAANFPSDMGYEVDTAELLSMRKRFADAGYDARADTILYAGRDTFPTYPTDDWDPVFYTKVRDIIDTYTIPFVDTAYRSLVVNKVMVGTEELMNFSVDSTNFVMELSESVTEVPEITIEAEGIEQLSIDYPEQLPGEAKVTAVAKDRSTGGVYYIFLSTDSAYWSVDFNLFIFNRTDTVVAQPGVYEYDLVLSEGNTKVKAILGRVKYNGQRYIKGDYPKEYPGVQTVDVISISGDRQVSYVFNVSLATSIADVSGNTFEIRVINPVKSNFQLIHHSTKPLDVVLSVYDISGKELKMRSLESVTPGKVNDIVDVSDLSEGVYLYSLKVNGIDYNGKFVKLE